MTEYTHWHVCDQGCYSCWHTQHMRCVFLDSHGGPQQETFADRARKHLFRYDTRSHVIFGRAGFCAVYSSPTLT
jgi:hypothetical protein